MNKILKLASDKWSGKTFRGRMYSKILVLAINSGKASPDATIKAIDGLLTIKKKGYNKLIKNISPTILQKILLVFREELNGGREYLNAFNVMCRYAEYMLKEDKYAIINNDFLATFNQMRQDISLPDIYINRIDSIARYINKSETNLQPYEQKVSEFQSMDEEEFFEFMKQLYQLRNNKGILPEKYCDYILRIKIDKNSQLSKNFKKFSSMYYRVYEDKALHILHKKGIYNYLTSSMPIIGAYGETYDKCHMIIYNKNKLSSGITQTDLSMVNTLFHEIQHAYQFEQIEKHNIQNEKQYYMLKEKIVRDIISDKFYEDNYFTQHTEIDANIRGVYKEMQLMEKLGMQIRGSIKKQKLNRLVEREKNRALKQKTTFILIDGKRIVERKYEYTDVIFQKVLPYALQQDPELFEKYPELRKEFNLDGTRRGNIEILKEYEERMEYSKKHPEEKGLKRLYPTILKNQSFLDDDTIMKDAQELLQYKPCNGVTKHYRDFIILNRILPRLRKWRENDANLIEYEHVKTLTAILNEFVIENEDKDEER